LTRLDDLRNKRQTTVKNKPPLPPIPGSGPPQPPPPPPPSSQKIGSALSKEEEALLKKVERLELRIKKPQVSEMNENEEKIYQQIQDPIIKDIYQYDMNTDERTSFDSLKNISEKDKYMKLRSQFREEFIDMPKQFKIEAIEDLTTKEVSKWIKSNRDILDKNKAERLTKLNVTKDKILKQIEKLFNDFDNPNKASITKQSTTEPKSTSVVDEMKVKKDIEKLEKLNKRFSAEKNLNLGNLQYNVRYMLLHALPEKVHQEFIDYVKVNYPDILPKELKTTKIDDLATKDIKAYLNKIDFNIFANIFSEYLPTSSFNVKVPNPNYDPNDPQSNEFIVVASIKIPQNFKNMLIDYYNALNVSSSSS